jgi:hypothetical protein
VVLASEHEYLLLEFAEKIEIKYPQYHGRGTYYTIEEVAFC